VGEWLNPLAWKTLDKLFLNEKLTSMGDPISICGEVAEWLKAHAWKACLRQKRNVGSNPTLSAKFCASKISSILDCPFSGAKFRQWHWLIDNKVQILKSAHA
jgi:hypothetical protein